MISAYDFIRRIIGSGVFVTEGLRRPSFGSIRDPMANDDSEHPGCEVGSAWMNTDTKKQFICLDNTPQAAVWLDASGFEGAMK